MCGDVVMSGMGNTVSVRSKPVKAARTQTRRVNIADVRAGDMFVPFYRAWERDKITKRDRAVKVYLAPVKVESVWLPVTGTDGKIRTKYGDYIVSVNDTCLVHAPVDA